jgi:simple sugar transport system permease protein
MQEVALEILLIGILLKTTLQMSTPLVLTALGGMFSEKSGVVNIGLEGMMLMGAFTAVWATFLTHNPWIGVLAAVASGGLLAAVHGIICVKFKGNHIVSGTGIILFGLGFTSLMINALWGVSGNSPSIAPYELPKVHLVFLRDIPILNAFSQLSPLIYLMFIISILSWYVMYKTPFGLRVRAAGEDPSTLDTAGVNVEWIRFIAVVISGCLAGLGGSYLSIGFNTLFREGMTSGRGFVALAALIFGNWTPVGTFLSGIFFGLLNGLPNVIQVAVQFWPDIAFLQNYIDWIATIPFFLVVIALAGIRKSVAPKGVGTPYEKEKRG